MEESPGQFLALFILLYLIEEMTISDATMSHDTGRQDPRDFNP